MMLSGWEGHTLFYLSKATELANGRGLWAQVCGRRQISLLSWVWYVEMHERQVKKLSWLALGVSEETLSGSWSRTGDQIRETNGKKKER